MSIPKARDMLDEVINSLGPFHDAAVKLRAVKAELYRRKAIRTGRSTRPHVEITPNLRQQILDMSKTHVTNSAIAAAVLGDAAHSGRVSEVLHGLR